MSGWLNLNDSLTTIRGQLTNLASDVLAEGIFGTDKSDEQATEPMSQTDRAQQSSDGCTRCVRLESAVEALRAENCVLVQNLEALDADCMQTTERLITLRDEKEENYKKLCLADGSIEDAGTSVENMIQQLVKRASTLDGRLSETVKEKNGEIEKLLKNSEELSREVEEKGRTISEYEEECNELLKNNEALIEELEGLKATGGLQTISESNEDSLVDLETQLDTANKTIRDLRDTVAELEDGSSKHEEENDSGIELEYVRKELHLTGIELSEAKKDYEELCNRHEELQSEFATLKTAMEKTKGDFENLEYKFSELTINSDGLTEENRSLREKGNETEVLLEDLRKTSQKLEAELMTFEKNCDEKENLIRCLTEELQEAKIAEADLKLQIESLTTEFNEAKPSETAQQAFEELAGRLKDTERQLQETYDFLVNKNAENLQYYNEIQRLNGLLAGVISQSELTSRDEQIGRLNTENELLRQKTTSLAQNLLDEQTAGQKLLADKQSVVDREQGLAKELERLRLHLVDIEDTYTRDLLEAQDRLKEAHVKLGEAEQREKDSSSLYTSVNIRANQQVETLQTQLQLVTVQRDELRLELDRHEDRHNKQTAALTNLQLVLEQFQRDKQDDVARETERVRRQIGVERAASEALRAEGEALRVQLDESKQGLQAAARLADQLERSKQQVTALREQEKKLRDSLEAREVACKQLEGQSDAKVDKSLVKNLIVGLLGSQAQADRHQILRIIATVLDFDQKECEKVKLHATPPPPNSSTGTVNESLSAAFVKFLQEESTPKVVPNLLAATRPSSVGSSQPPSRKTSSVLGEIVLPTFGDFGPNRNSGSILKDVLKDNT